MVDKNLIQEMLAFNISCEGCSLRLPIYKRKKKCEDCGFVFCTDCASAKGRLYQCYRCRVLTCLPINGRDLESLRLRDLQWFLETKRIEVSSNELREKPVLVERILSYSRQMVAQSIQTQNNSHPFPAFSLLPESPPAGGLFGTEATTSAGEENPSESGDELANRLSEEVVNPNPTPGRRRPIFNLDSVKSRKHIFELTIMELKVLLARNYMSFHGCLEKSELQEKVCSIWDSQVKAQNATSDENLCKLCWEAGVNSLFLECGHMLTCHLCGKLLQYCPICRQVIVRVVRAFKA